jgi:hypothetical protein
VYWEHLCQGGTGSLLAYCDDCICLIPILGAIQDGTDERKQASMKQTNNGSSGANGGKPKMSSGRATKRGSRVTEERAKLDAQAETRHVQAEEETAAQKTQNKKKARQDLQAKRCLIETLIESYIQDHIGGNHSEKTIEWHRTALGLMRLFLQEELDITQIDDVKAEDISAWFAQMRQTIMVPENWTG